MSEAPKKRWYVVQAFSGFEGRVATSLREHIKLHNMEELFGEVMVPTEEVVEIRGGQRRKSERKFFPGYVLVQMVMNDASWHLVRSVPRVMVKWFALATVHLPTLTVWLKKWTTRSLV